MGLFSKITDRIAEEKAAWDASGAQLDKNDAERARREAKQPKDTKNTSGNRGVPGGDGGAGAVANFVVD